MKNLLFKLSILPLFLVVFTACEPDDHEYLSAPALEGGECEYTHTGLTQVDAQAELDRVVNIFQSSFIGSYPVVVKKKNVYVSETVNGQPDRFGLQVVFTCNDASLKYEESSYFSSSGQRDVAYDARVAQINNARLLKFLRGEKDSESYDVCDTCTDYVYDECYDEENDEYYECGGHYVEYDCNCRTYTDYYYDVRYLQVTGAATGASAKVGESSVNEPLELRQLMDSLIKSKAGSLKKACPKKSAKQIKVKPYSKHIVRS